MPLRLAAGSDARMALVAERLVVAGTATTKPRGLRACDSTPGTAEDLQVAVNTQRPIDLMIDLQHSVAHLKQIVRSARRLAVCVEHDLSMGIVTDGLRFDAPQRPNPAGVPARRIYPRARA